MKSLRLAVLDHLEARERTLGRAQKEAQATQRPFVVRIYLHRDLGIEMPPTGAERTHVVRYFRTAGWTDVFFDDAATNQIRDTILVLTVEPVGWPGTGMGVGTAGEEAVIRIGVRTAHFILATAALLGADESAGAPGASEISASNSIRETIRAGHDMADSGDVGSAASLWKEAADAFRNRSGRETPMSVPISNALEEAALESFSFGDTATARHLLDALLNFWESDPDKDRLQGIRLRIAERRKNIGDVQGAYLLEEQVCREIECEPCNDYRRGITPFCEEVIKGLAHSHYLLGDLETALELEEALLEERLFWDSNGIVTQRSRLRVAAIRFELGLYEDAMRLQAKALRALETQLGNTDIRTQDAILDLARSRKRTGSLRAALDLEERVYEIQRTVLAPADPRFHETCLRVAATRSELGDLRGAFELQDYVYRLQVGSLRPDDPELLRTTLKLASTRAELGDLRGALKLEEHALARLKELFPKEHPDLLAAMQNLSITRLRLGDLRGALELQEPLLRVRERILKDYDPDLQAARVNLATTLFRMGDRAGALELEEKALSVYTRILPDEHPVLQKTRRNVAMTLLALGRTAPARAILTEAIRGSSEHHETLLRTFNVRTQSEAARISSGVLSTFLSTSGPGSGRPAGEDLEAVVNLRSTLERQSRLFAAIHRFRDDDAELGSLLRRRNSLLEEYLATFTREGVDDLERSMTRDRLERSEEQLVRCAFKNDDLTRMFGHIELDELAGTIPPGTVVITTASYTRLHPAAAGGSFQGQETATGFIIHSGGAVKRVEIGATGDVDAAVAVFRASVEHGPGNIRAPRGGAIEDDDSIMRPVQLSELLDPLLTEIPPRTRRIVISPDGKLATIPWEAVVSNGRMLGEDYLITYVESLSSRLASSMESRPPSLLLLGDIDYGGEPEETGAHKPEPLRPGLRKGSRNWVRLPGTAREIDSIQAAFRQTVPEAPVRTLRDREASRASFVNLASGFTMIHLATHAFGEVSAEADGEVQEQAFEDIGGVRFVDRGLLSGIVFSGANRDPGIRRERSILTATELGALDLSDCVLAVLSACETNVGDRYSGEAVTGLNRALQLAGARNTITSLWKVDDAGTALFFEHFYRLYLRGGMSIPKAFREVRKSMRDRGFKSGVWAGFVLYTAGLAAESEGGRN